VCVICDYCGYSRKGWEDNVKINIRKNISVIQKEMEKFVLLIDNIIIYILRILWAHTYLFV
jgi:GT2 family glycosyltransferase